MTAQAQRTLILLLIVAGLSGYLGYDFGQNGYALKLKRFSPQVEVVNKVAPVESLDFGLFWTVLDLLNKKSLSGPLEGKKILYGAIKGLTDSLGDPYTTFLTPEQNSLLSSSLEGKYEGIGAELGMKEDKDRGGRNLVIVTPLDGSPAKKAGLKPGDIVAKIEDKETLGLSITEAVSRIRGEAGTTVRLTIIRSSEKKPLDLKVVRSKITVPSLVFEDKEKGVAYIRLSRFGETTNGEWDELVKKITNRKTSYRAVVLDVRSNPGGYLQSAIHIASEFVRSGVIVFEELADQERTPFYSDHVGRLVDLPVVVLINQGSASASEILAGALHDLRGAEVVGEKSFGKGSVQEPKTFPDGSGIHITIARWLTPEGRSIHGEGIEPGFKVEMTDADSESGRDPQLEKALEIANSGKKTAFK